MPRFHRFVLAIVLVFPFLAILSLPAQSQSADDVHIVPRAPGDVTPDKVVDPELRTRTKPLKVDVNLVLVPVSVMDDMNRPVLGLRQDDFSLYEGKNPQHIKFFSNEDAPISVGVILDLSGSMANKIETERAAVVEFFKNANPADDYFVITFARRPQVTADTTKSIADIEAKLVTAQPAGYTALLDAVYLGVQKLRSARYQRRALVIISDGGDNSSRYKLREIKSLVQEADVQIYGIGIFDDGFPVFNTIEEKLGRHLMNEVTEATGGRTVAIRNLVQLPEAAAAISRELRNQYVLGYQPPIRKANGRREDDWRKIKVTLSAGAKGRHAYYKRGYSAPIDTTASSSVPDR